MEYENYLSENIIRETIGDYQLNNQVLINNKLLNEQESIEYFHNKYEFDIEKEIRNIEATSHFPFKDILKYINKKTSHDLDSFPMKLSLYGDRYLDQYKYELTDDFQMLESKLIVNDKTSSDFLINHLKNELITCSSFDIVVSFIRGSGLNMLINTLDILTKRGIKGRIITTTYMNVTEPNAMRVLSNYPNIELKVYESDNQTDSFHTKGYIFHRNKNYGSTIVGSSNITAAALKTGEEWNIRTYERASDSIFNNMKSRFERLWNNEKTRKVTAAFIDKYEYFLESENLLRPFHHSFNSKKELAEDKNIFVPNSMQKTAIENLLASIDQGSTRGIAIAATGTGKTFLAAMCADELQPKNVLFVAHRLELLNGAKETFHSVFNQEPDENFVIYKGSKRDTNRFTFASIQSLYNDLDQFEPEDFDLIIIDEFHHATSKTYMNVINKFNPKFLLGLTATPERTDGGDIYELAEYNIIVDVRLQHALDSELLVPFQYYGISDQTVNLALDKDIKEDDLVKALNTNQRVDFIIEKMVQYTLTDERRCLAFCQNIDHANYMNEAFQNYGFHSTVLTGKDTDKKREEVLKHLQDETHPLNIVFVVDLFNEGIDIPKINLILFLRPTDSAIIFTQQLGRGLRKAENKDYLIVLDFVTNDRNNYLIPIALNGDREFIDKKKIKNNVKKNFSNLSNSVHIELDHISKEQILKSIDNTDFKAAEFIKKDTKYFLEVIRIETENKEKKLSIMDFYNFEQAPDPSRLFKSTYKNLSILNKRINEEREVDKEINESKLLTFVMNQIMNFIPVKMLYDPVILIKVILEKSVSIVNTIKYVESKMSVKLNEQAKKKIHYAFNRISKFQFEKKNLFKYEDDTLIFNLEVSTSTQKELEEFLEYIVLSYKQEFNPNLLNQQYELIRNNQYKRSETLALVGYDKSIDSLREGVLQYKGDHYLYVNLEKNKKTVEEHLLYDDYFISDKQFHWQSQNQTHEDTPTGQQYIHHKENGSRIHLFVRRENEEDKRTLPFYYLGEVEYETHTGGSPMSIIWNFKHSVPKEVMDDLEN